MGIRRKIFYITTASMLSILLISFIIIYLFLYHVIYDETVKNQQVFVELNRQTANNFVQSIHHTTIQLVSDKALGGYLSYTGTDSMTRLISREAISSQFSHYSTHQVIDSTYYYKNYLFLSDTIPISDIFEAYTPEDNPYAASNLVSSNHKIKDEDWYQKALKQGTYVFSNENTNDFCIARRIINTYYTGPSSSIYTAVMLVTVKREQLEKVFSSIPVTQGSGYALFNREQELLYTSSNSIDQKDYLNAWQAYLKDGNPQYTTAIGGKTFLASYCDAQYGIQMLFLVPQKDITDGIMPIMYTYTFIFMVFTLITLAMLYILTGRMTRPIILLSEKIASIQDTRNFDTKSLYISSEKELVILACSFEQLINNVNLKIEDIRVQNESEKRSQLRALQAQINPHFIFNAMDMVNWLALSRNCDDIASIVDSIAKLMRYSITDADSLVPLELELSNIREFISIYQMRHNNKLQLHTEILLEGVTIPKFSLQPLVENSVRHATVPPDSNLIITIRCCSQEGSIVLYVTDNGTGSNAEQMNRHLQYDGTNLQVSSGFGIRNVNERIRLWCGNGSRLYYQNLPDGNLAAIVLLDTASSKSSNPIK